MFTNTYICRPAMREINASIHTKNIYVCTHLKFITVFFARLEVSMENEVCTSQKIFSANLSAKCICSQLQFLIFSSANHLQSLESIV